MRIYKIKATLIMTSVSVAGERARTNGINRKMRGKRKAVISIKVDSPLYVTIGKLNGSFQKERSGPSTTDHDL